MDGSYVRDGDHPLVQSAREMVPTLRARAELDDAAGATRPDTVQEYIDRGLTRLLQPRRWGGAEAPLGTLVDIETELGRGDQSAAWTYAVTQGHAFHLALFDDRAQQDVWGENPDALIASPYNPLGKVAAVRDGYTLEGAWQFSSGCDHCQWFLLGGYVDGDTAQRRAFLVPRADVEIVDDWKVLGLKGSGSKMVKVAKTFVPGYRTLPHGPDKEFSEFPGFEKNTNPMYRVPFYVVFNRSITSTCIGGLAGMIDAVLEYLGPKISVSTAKAVAEHPDVLLHIGEALAVLDELKILAHHDLDWLQDLAARGQAASDLELTLARLRGQMVGERSVDAARRLFEACGGGGVYEKRPIGRIYRNLVTARNHPAIGGFRDMTRAAAMNALGRPVIKSANF